MPVKLNAAGDKQPVNTSCAKPAAGATKVEWAKYIDCLVPPTSTTSTCYVSFRAMVWQSTQGANWISVATATKQVDFNRDALDAALKPGGVPDLWRHLPSDLPDSWQSLPSSRPAQANALVLVMPATAPQLGITPSADLFPPKWPDCTPVGITLVDGKIPWTGITLTGSDGSRHTVHGGTSSRSLVFDNLSVKLPDDGEPWPASITKIAVAGTFLVEDTSGVSKTGIDILNESFAPRPLAVDFTSAPTALTLSCNGLGFFPGAKSKFCSL